MEGPLRISAPGVILQNTRITGDLVLTAAIGDGCADLVRVFVEDTVLVQGGGENTVVFEDAVINELVIDKKKARCGLSQGEYRCREANHLGGDQPFS